MNKYNTFWPRFFAIFLDGIILSLFTQVLELFTSNDSKLVAFIFNMIISNIPYLYSIYLIGAYGQTYGKMIMKIKVVDFETENKISYSQSLKREIIPLILVNVALVSGYLLFDGIDVQNYEYSLLDKTIIFLPTFMLVIWSILEIVTMLNDDKRRALHDKIADTIVIRTS